MSSTKYNQYVGDAEDIEILMEDEDLPKVKKIRKKKKRFDDGTSVKHNHKKYTRHRETKE